MTETERNQLRKTLWGIENLIATRADQLAALKQHKQGLLQQLFPVMDAATA